MTSTEAPWSHRAAAGVKLTPRRESAVLREHDGLARQGAFAAGVLARSRGRAHEPALAALRDAQPADFGRQAAQHGRSRAAASRRRRAAARASARPGHFL